MSIKKVDTSFGSVNKTNQPTKQTNPPPQKMLKTSTLIITLLTRIIDWEILHCSYSIVGGILDY